MDHDHEDAWHTHTLNLILPSGMKSTMEIVVPKLRRVGIEVNCDVNSDGTRSYEFYAPP